MGLLSGLKKAVKKVKSGVSSVAKSVKTGVTSTAKKAGSGITSTVKKVASAVKTGATNVKSFVKDGYLASAVKGAVTGFASGGIVGAVVGAGAGMAAQKLASLDKGEEYPEGAEPLNISEEVSAGQSYDLSTVDGVNAYFKDSGNNLTVDKYGVVYDGSGKVVAQYNFSTFEMSYPTEETKSASASNTSATWRDRYNQATTAYWASKGEK